MAKSEIISDLAETVLQTASEIDLERLVRGIGKDTIVHLVKHDRHLQQDVFRGFRADHLLWDQVPAKLARDARNIERRRALLKWWLITNEEICERISQDIHPETIEDDVAEILTTTTIDSDHLYWALLLDERKDIQQALKTEGILQALFDPASDLMVRVERYRLAQQLEIAKVEIASLNGHVKELEAEKSLVAQRFADLEKQHTDLLQEKTSLLTQTNELLTQASELKQQVERLREQNSLLQASKEASQAEIDQLRSSQLKDNKDDEGTSISHQVDISMFDSLWLQTVDDLKLYFNLDSVDSSFSSFSGDERWSDWRHWQYIEQLLIHPLLDAQIPLSQEKLPELIRAQKLLVLRWYLLEWMKNNVFERLDFSADTF